VAENNVKTVNSDQLAVISKKKQANTSRGRKDSLGVGVWEKKLNSDEITWFFTLQTLCIVSAILLA